MKIIHSAVAALLTAAVSAHAGTAGDRQGRHHLGDGCLHGME